MELCAKTPSEERAAAFAKFQEIKRKAEGGSLGTYLANRFVRQRLLEIVDAEPYHLSARLLALQGAGERPRLLARKVLAAEVWRAVAPIEALPALDFRVENAESVKFLETRYESMRADFDNLDRYADSRDKDLVSEGSDLTTTVRTLARALRNRTDGLGQRYQAINAAHAAMVAANNALVVKLSQLSGDPLADQAGRFGRAATAAELLEN